MVFLLIFGYRLIIIKNNHGSIDFNLSIFYRRICRKWHRGHVSGSIFKLMHDAKCTVYNYLWGALQP